MVDTTCIGKAKQIGTKKIAMKGTIVKIARISVPHEQHSMLESGFPIQTQPQVAKTSKSIKAQSKKAKVFESSTTVTNFIDLGDLDKTSDVI